ncbi:MAG: MocE family 2Fe-2S type ferredoxin [Acetobacteraceae bacterium]
MANWVEACKVGEIEAEEVAPFDHGGHRYAIYRSPADQYYATDAVCTHEDADLTEGLVIEHIIECPRHNGRFDYRTGAAKGAPVCVNLKTYPVKVERGAVFLDLG